VFSRIFCRVDDVERLDGTILIVTSIFAHRGHHVYFPENSAAAIAAANDVGADGVEFDVWLTSDKFLIVNHDRTVGGQSIPATRRVDLAREGEITSLDDAVHAAGPLRINVEIKSTRSVPYNLAVARDVAAFLDASSVSAQCLVSSFSLAVCDEVRRVSPERRVGWLAERRPAAFVLDQVTSHRLTSAHLAFSRVNAAVADDARQRGVELHVWTPNLARDIGRMLELGVGAVITDDVVLARRLRDGLGPTE